MRIAGLNATAARFAGIPVNRSTLLAVTISGSLAGLAGAVEVQALFHRLEAGVGSDYGYTAIPIALLGRMLPGPTLLASFLLAALNVAAAMMQLKASVPLPLVSLLEGCIILFVVSSEGLKRRGKDWLSKWTSFGPQTAEDFEVMCALRKGQAAIFNLTRDVCGEGRIVERAFGIGPSALTEIIALIGESLNLKSA